MQLRLSERFQERPDTVHRDFNLFQIRRIATTHMPLAGGPERGAGDDDDLLFRHESVAEFLTGKPGGTDGGENVERAFGFVAC